MLRLAVLALRFRAFCCRQRIVSSYTNGCSVPEGTLAAEGDCGTSKPVSDCQCLHASHRPCLVWFNTLAGNDCMAHRGWDGDFGSCMTLGAISFVQAHEQMV